MPTFDPNKIAVASHANVEKAQQGRHISHQLREGIKLRELADEKKRTEIPKITGVVGEQESGLLLQNVNLK